MKKLILLSLISLSLFGQKKSTDVVDFNNFDYVYAEDLLHQKFNTELAKMFPDKRPFVKDSIAFKAMEYQLSHFKNGGKFEHDNVEKFRGVLLSEPSDRIEFFLNKKLKSTSIEVLHYTEEFYYIRDTSKVQWYVKDGNNMIKTERKDDNREYYKFNPNDGTYKCTKDYNVIYNDMITYEYLINDIFVSLFIKSKAHSIFIQSSYKQELNCFWKIEVKKLNNGYRLWGGSVFFDRTKQ